MDENADFEIDPSVTPPDRKKKGISPLIPPLVTVVTIIFVGIVIGNVLWLLCSDVLALHQQDISGTFTVSAQDSLTDISKNLKQQGYLQYPWLFRLYVKVTDSQDKIKPGTYTLSTRYDYHALVKVLSAGKVSRSLSFYPTHQGETERICRNWNY